MTIITKINSIDNEDVLLKFLLNHGKLFRSDNDKEILFVFESIKVFRIIQKNIDSPFLDKLKELARKFTSYINVELPTIKEIISSDEYSLDIIKNAIPYVYANPVLNDHRIVFELEDGTSFKAQGKNIHEVEQFLKKNLNDYYQNKFVYYCKIIEEIETV